ncbi:hypothetical protein PAXRUDRAFT_502872 [Paxillus rubicundulus Ve08.2h10]|uniref:Uncharacterized protein n=1 Tax=Paxillus rubicundulus Ve08.2h10 TaxID=930991 RepID=A0A0D0D553_9AGAM|nr:hypothetical protein PAXRUDRAFT_502872 [Paxillus rubicundulus Ve08.2h10]
MKTLLTLLAAITSLNSYTLVGVHAASCAICPSLGGMKLAGNCHFSVRVTLCQYQNAPGTVSTLCFYDDNNGALKNKGFIASCPNSVTTGSQCSPDC